MTTTAYSQFANTISTTSNIPTVPIVPFCPTAGFTVGGTVEWYDCANVEVYVVLEARPKFENTRLEGGYSTDEDLFNVVQYLGGAGSPVLQSVIDLSGSLTTRTAFKFTFPAVPDEVGGINGHFSVTFPFKFDPIWFFGDGPWKVHVYARNACLNPGPLTVSELGVLEASTLAGTLIFEAPYYPIVGSQNISQYPEITAWSKDGGKAHSIMLLPDQNGNPPVLTIDQALFQLGFNGQMINSPNFFSDRGNIYMCPGAQIKVVNGKTFEVFANMFTCDLVSKGIVVEPNGVLRMSSSRINDAEIAVHIKRDADFYCATTDFTNSYLHIKLDNTGATGSNLQAFIGPLIRIRTIGSIKGKYPGMVNPEAPKGYGMEIIRVPYQELGSTRFSDLNNGIYGDRSSITTRGYFYNIQPAAFTTALRQGWAIYAKGTGVEKLDYNGGTALPDFDDIQDCDRGIYVNNMDVALQKIEISANRGIYLQNCKNNRLIVQDNPKIASKLYGIQSQLCLPADQLSRISNNTIGISLPGNNLTTGVGITMREFFGVTEPNGTTGWRLWDNDITLQRAYTGIKYEGSDNSGFWRNQVTLTDQSYNHYVGFDLLNSKKLTLSCNEVTRPAGSDSYGSNTTGYRVKNVSSTVYTGNETSLTARGMAFTNLCDASRLLANEFNFHIEGLRLAANVVLGTQGKDVFAANGNLIYVQDHGNCWAGSPAFHAATQASTVQLSAFGVDPVEMVCFLPFNNKGDIWFSQELTPTQPSFALTDMSCSLPFTVYNPTLNPGGGKLDRAIADGSITTAGLPGVTAKMLENHLYGRLMENSTLAGQSPYQQFLTAKSGTTTESFYRVRLQSDVIS